MNRFRLILIILVAIAGGYLYSQSSYRWNLYKIEVLKDEALNIELMSDGGVIVSSRVATISKDQIVDLVTAQAKGLIETKIGDLVPKKLKGQVIDLVTAKMTTHIDAAEVSSETKEFGKKAISYVKDKIKDKIKSLPAN